MVSKPMDCRALTVVYLVFSQRIRKPVISPLSATTRELQKMVGWPTILCNTLEVADSGEITGFRMRCEKSKYTTVKALQSIGFETIASGDSYNDLAMIQASKAGFLFKSTEKIKADHPEIPAYEEFDDLLAAIKKAI